MSGNPADMFSRLPLLFYKWAGVNMCRQKRCRHVFGGGGVITNCSTAWLVLCCMEPVR